MRINRPINVLCHCLSTNRIFKWRWRFLPTAACSAEWVGLTFCQPNNATSMEFITYEKGRMRTGKQVPLIHDNSAVCGPDTQSDCTNDTWPWNRGTPGWWFSDPAGRAMFLVISGLFEMTAGTSICFDVGFIVVCHSLWKVHDEKA